MDVRIWIVRGEYRSPLLLNEKIRQRDKPSGGLIEC